MRSRSEPDPHRWQCSNISHPPHPTAGALVDHLIKVHKIDLDPTYSKRKWWTDDQIVLLDDKPEAR